jgi:hypothetical protein
MSLAMRIRCFLIRPTEQVLQAVSVYLPGCHRGLFHRAEVYRRVEIQPNADTNAVTTISGEEIERAQLPGEVPCADCGTMMTVNRRTASISAGRRYARTDTGEVRDQIADFGVGAMWFATWYRRDDGLYGWDFDNLDTPPLIVRTPGGAWDIDSRSHNCAWPMERTHRCWVREGEPPKITVSKQGHSCPAGAGSIQMGGYHGFLRDGELSNG